MFFLKYKERCLEKQRYQQQSKNIPEGNNIRQQRLQHFN